MAASHLRLNTNEVDIVYEAQQDGKLVYYPAKNRGSIWNCKFGFKHLTQKYKSPYSK